MVEAENVDETKSSIKQQPSVKQKLSVKQKQSIKQQPSTLIPTMRKSSKMQSFRCGNWKFNHSDKKTANKTELSTRMQLYSDFISVKRRKLNRYHWDRQNLCCRFSVINLRESHFSYLAQGQFLRKMIAFWPLDCTIVHSHHSIRSPYILNQVLSFTRSTWVLHIAKVGGIPSPYLDIVEEQISYRS